MKVNDKQISESIGRAEIHRGILPVIKSLFRLENIGFDTRIAGMVGDIMSTNILALNLNFPVVVDGAALSKNVSLVTACDKFQL